MKFATSVCYGLVIALSGITFLSAPAYAVTVSYTVNGVGPTSYPSALAVPVDAPNGVNGYPGDTVELQSYTGTFNLTPGTSIQQVNNLLWTIDYTYGGTSEADWTNPTFAINADRNIIIDSVTGTLHQSGQLVTTWYNDTLSFASGSTLSLLVDGYKVDITPLLLPGMTGGDLGAQPQQTMSAQFVVSETPLPATLPLLVSGLGGLGLLGWRKKRNTNFDA